jgi:hypothetical protein
MSDFSRSGSRQADIESDGFRPLVNLKNAKDAKPPPTRSRNLRSLITQIPRPPTSF